MTPQEAADEAFQLEKERNINFWQKEEEIADEIAYWKDVFMRGYNKASEQSNQALSSALKEIAELHAKMKDLKEVMCENCRIKQNLKLWANGDEGESYPRPVMTSKNTYGFTSESQPETDSANLPPEVTA